MYHLDKTVAPDVEVCLYDLLESLCRAGQLLQDGEPQVVLEHLLVVPVRLLVAWRKKFANE